MEPPRKSKCGDHQTLSDHNPGKNWENNGVRYTEMSSYHYLHLLSGKPLKRLKHLITILQIIVGTLIHNSK